MRMELRSRIWVLALAAAIPAIAACDNAAVGGGGPAPTPEVIEATLSGDQEVPPVETDATGSLRAELLDDQLTITGTFQGLGSDLLDVQGSPAHIHEGAPGQAGPILLNVDVTPAADNRSGTFRFDGQLAAAQLAALQAGNLYVNVHTVTHPAGEIRAQLGEAPAGEVRFTVQLSGASEVPANQSAASGSATIVLAGNDLTIDGTFQGLTSELHEVAGTPAHVHRAPAGQAGPILWNIDVVAGADRRSGTFSLDRTLTDDERAAFLANELYINVHSQTYPGGELRAQLRRGGVVSGGGTGTGGTGTGGTGTGGTGTGGTGGGGSGGGGVPGY